MDDKPYCAAVSAQADEPMLGTAVRADAWLMVEFDGLWERKALTDNALPEVVNRWIERTRTSLTGEYGVVRPQFIKRRRSVDEDITVMFAAGGTLWRRQFADYGALSSWSLTADEMIEEPHPQYFVCTNGRRDRCCSRFGLPLYRKLREAVGERAWETTHTGGHRFAPNVLALPQGALYGRVLEKQVADFVGAVDRGEFVRANLRGRSVLPPSAQIVDAELAGAGEFIDVDGEWVRFRVDGEVVSHRVEKSATAYDVLGSCRDDAAEPVYPLLWAASD